MDKHKENGIILGKEKMIQYCSEVVPMEKSSPELLNDVYREISEKLGMEVAISIYQMFRGQQISFPVRLFNPVMIRMAIVNEYDGTNVRALAIKYNYSEKTVRRVIKESLENQ